MGYARGALNIRRAIEENRRLRAELARASAPGSRVRPSRCEKAGAPAAGAGPVRRGARRLRRRRGERPARPKRLRSPAAVSRGVGRRFVVGRLMRSSRSCRAGKYRARAEPAAGARRIEVSGPARGDPGPRRGRTPAVSVEVSLGLRGSATTWRTRPPAACALAPLLRRARSEKIARDDLTQAKGFVWIARKVEPPVADQIRALKFPRRAPGRGAQAVLSERAACRLGPGIWR